MKTALIQMRTVLDKTQNVADAVAQIAAAAQQGADLAVLPEMFCCPYDNVCFRAYGETAGGPGPDGPVPDGRRNWASMWWAAPCPSWRAERSIIPPMSMGRPGGSFWQSTGRSICSTSTWAEASALWSRTRCPPGTRHHL